MAEVVKTLTIKDNRDSDFITARLCQRKADLTENWIKKRFVSYRGKKMRIKVEPCRFDVIFYFNDPAEATWVRLMKVNNVVEV